MGSIITSGIGSGLDIQGLVSQLVAAEGAPKSLRLNREEATLQSKLSAMGTLRSALSELQSALASLKDLDSFRGRTVAQTSEDFVSVSASATAPPGRFAIEVEQLASAQRLASDPYADPATLVGTGTLTIAVGAQSFSLDIDGETSSLTGIRDAINGAADNTGVVATIINALDGSRLILSATDTGLENAMTVTQSDGDGGLAALEYDPVNLITNLTELDPALDARVLLEGFAVEGSSNTISGAVDGVDISLLGENAPGEETDIAIDFDREGARAAVAQLVDSYNALVDAVAGLSGYDPETEAAGPLLGDSTLRNITTRLRSELSAAVSGLTGPFGSLFEVGISTQLNGKLALDGSKLDEAFNLDFDSVGTLFADTELGIANRLDAILEPFLSAGGLLDARTDGLNASIADIGERREALEARLVAVEARLFDQFNGLDSLLAQLQSTSNFLGQQLANLPGVVLPRKDDS